jgi:hypothetical protein
MLTIGTGEHSMRSFKIFGLIVLFGSIVTLATPARAQQIAGSQIITVSPYAIVDVSQLPVAEPQAVQTVKLAGRHFAHPELLAAEKQALASATGSTHGKGGGGGGGGGGSGGGTNSGFDGIGFLASGGYVPPDTVVAAGVDASGNKYIFEAVNLEGEIFNASGSSLKSFSLYGFFNIPTSDNITDPRILFDSSTGRWFVITSTFGPSSAYGWNLAVSASADPTGSCYLYEIPTSGSFPDFPKVGYNSNKVVITGDAFSGNKFLGTEFVVIDKANLLNGTLTYQIFGPQTIDFAIEPAQHLAPVGTATTSNSDALYMASVAYASPTPATVIDVWTVTGVPGSSTVSAGYTSLKIGALSIPPNAVQAGTKTTIDTNDNALLDAVFRDGNPGELWVSANDGCKPTSTDSTRSCLRLIEVSIDPSVTPPTPTMQVAQDFDYSAAGQYYFYPAIRTDSSGNLAVVFNGSSGSEYVSVYTATYPATMTNGPLQNVTLERSGSAPYTLAAQAGSTRWGDYSGAGIDPDDTTVWLGGEYPTSCGRLIKSCWGTWITSVTP